MQVGRDTQKKIKYRRANETSRDYIHAGRVEEQDENNEIMLCYNLTPAVSDHATAPCLQGSRQESRVFHSERSTATFPVSETCSGTNLMAETECSMLETERCR